MIDITTNIRDVIAKMKRIPKQLERATLPALQSTVEEIKRIMQRAGLLVRYPINWDSQKQKRFVIAKLRRENNLPYQRSGAHSAGWFSESVANGYTLSNIGNKAVFLYGTASGNGLPGASKVLPTGQSHIHEGRWRLVRPVIDAVLSKLPRKILDAFRIDVNA